MVARVQVRTITNDEGNKLLRIVRRSSGSPGRDLAAGADGAAVRAGHGRGQDRRGHLH
jgi:hypothetical protein